MSDDLDRAIDVRVASFHPRSVPRFADLEVRSRARTRRRYGLSGAALAVAVISAFVVIPGLSIGEPDRLPTDVGRTADSAQPGAVEICLGDAACRTLDRDTAAGIATALNLDGAQPVDDPLICRGGQGAPYRVLIHGSDAAVQAVEVPSICAPMTFDGQQYAIDETVRDQVRRAYEQAARTGPQGGWTGVRICRTSPVGPCKDLGPEVADQLNKALDIGNRAKADPRVIYDCAASPILYSVRFQHPSVRSAEIVVPHVCEPMKVAQTLYEIDQQARDAVSSAFQR